MGKINPIKSRVLVKNLDVYFVGCSCHMAHNAARKGGDSKDSFFVKSESLLPHVTIKCMGWLSFYILDQHGILVLVPCSVYKQF
jgi:hypothetical protein